MALIANLVRTQISDDGLVSVWTDQTVYGSPNPDRNQVAVYLTAFKVDSNQVESPLTTIIFDPEVATTFTTANDVDGWYKYYFIIVNNWLIGTVYNRYDVVWDTTTNKFYQYINSAPSSGNAVTDTIHFSVLADPTVVINDVGTSEAPGNIAYQVINKILTVDTSQCYLKLAARNAKENCGDGGDCGCESKVAKNLMKVRNLFTNMGFDELQGKFIQGEKNARLAEKYCSDCGCLRR